MKCASGCCGMTILVSEAQGSFREYEGDIFSRKPLAENVRNVVMASGFQCHTR